MCASQGCPDCLHASTACCCQRVVRVRARSASSFTSQRAVSSGSTSLAPASQTPRTKSSIVPPLGIPCATVMLGWAASTVRVRVTSTTEPSPSADSSLPSSRWPSPSSSTNGSPRRARRLRTKWALSSPDKRRREPAAAVRACAGSIQARRGLMPVAPPGDRKTDPNPSRPARSPRRGASRRSRRASGYRRWRTVRATRRALRSSRPGWCGSPRSWR